FDPVYSKGLPSENSFGGYSKDALPPNVQHSAEAISMNETRTYFKPSLLEQTPANVDLKQEYFVGVHSDIGGHRDNNPNIMKLTRSFILSEAARAGVPVAPQFILSEREVRKIESNPVLLKPSPEGSPSFQGINPVPLVAGQSFMLQEPRGFISA